MQLARTVFTPVLNAGNFDYFEVGLLHAYIHQRLYLETVTVDFHVVEAVPPKGVIAVAQIGVSYPEKHVDQLA